MFPLVELPNIKCRSISRNPSDNAPECHPHLGLVEGARAPFLIPMAIMNATRLFPTPNNVKHLTGNL